MVIGISNAFQSFSMHKISILGFRSSLRFIESVRVNSSHLVSPIVSEITQNICVIFKCQMVFYWLSILLVFPCVISQIAFFDPTLLGSITLMIYYFEGVVIMIVMLSCVTSSCRIYVTLKYTISCVCFSCC